MAETKHTIEAKRQNKTFKPGLKSGPLDFIKIPTKKTSGHVVVVFVRVAILPRSRPVEWIATCPIMQLSLGPPNCILHGVLNDVCSDMYGNVLFGSVR